MDGFIGSIIVGCVAGFLASKLMKGKGMGCLWNIVLGVVGGVVGGKLLSWLNVEWGGLIGQIGTAMVGAVVVLWVASLFRKN